MIKFRLVLIKSILFIPILIFNLFQQLIKILLIDILSIILLSILLIAFTDVSLKFGFFLSVIILGFFDLILNHKVFIETFETLMDSIAMGIYLGSFIKIFGKKGESPHVSREITVENKHYRVIIFGKGLMPQLSKREMPPATGYLVLDGDTFEVIDNIDILRKVLRIFKLWHYMYIHPLLGDLSHNKTIVKKHLKFVNALNRLIKKNKKDNYSKIREKRSEEHTKVLMELDDEVLKQSPYLTQKLELQLQILDKIIDVFRKPSDFLYDDILKKIDSMKKLSVKENKIWNKRLNTWKKLTDIYSTKIEKIPRASIKVPTAGFLADLINMIYFKSVAFGATIVAVIFEIGKIFLRISGKFAVNTIVYHKLGIDAIQSNIETNKDLSKLANMYHNILTEEDIRMVRT